MGEMASSVAHELNQPLTAINNYCSGMVSRIQSGQLTEEPCSRRCKNRTPGAQRAARSSSASARS